MIHVVVRFGLYISTHTSSKVVEFVILIVIKLLFNLQALRRYLNIAEIVLDSTIRTNIMCKIVFKRYLSSALRPNNTKECLLFM